MHQCVKGILWRERERYLVCSAEELAVPGERTPLLGRIVTSLVLSVGAAVVVLVVVLLLAGTLVAIVLALVGRLHAPTTTVSGCALVEARLVTRSL